VKFWCLHSHTGGMTLLPFYQAFCCCHLGSKTDTAFQNFCRLASRKVPLFSA